MKRFEIIEENCDNAISFRDNQTGLEFCLTGHEADHTRSDLLPIINVLNENDATPDDR